MIVPFDESGNMKAYVGYSLDDDEINTAYEEGEYTFSMWNETTVWKPNKIFDDELEYIGYGRGRSSIKLYFKSRLSNKEYEMFMSDFNKLMIDGKFDNPLKGKFTFCKRGLNYGIKLIEKEV